MRPHLLLASVSILALPLALTGCVNTDAAVFVEPTIEHGEAAVSGGTLGVSVKGAFTLKLHLGPRASDSSKVDLVSFNLLDAGQKAEITPIVLSMQDSTITVAPETDTTQLISFDIGGKTLPSATKPKLCDPAGIVIGGVLQDSLLATSTPFFSPIVHPTGCP